MKSSPLSNLLSEFARSLLDDAGLSGIASRVATGIPLGQLELSQLCDLPLPLLNILCSIRQNCRRATSADIPRIIVIPNAVSNDLPRQNQAVTEVLSYLQNFHFAHDEVQFTFESWRRNNSQEEFLDFLHAVLREIELSEFVLIGPPSELLEHELADPEMNSAQVQKFFHCLTLFPKVRLRIDIDSAFYDTCLASGVPFELSHSLPLRQTSTLRLDPLASANRIISLLAKLPKVEQLYSWEPKRGLSLSDFSVDAPLRFDLLRTIAIVSLLLPESAQVRLAPQLLGPSLTHLSRHFGVQHWGPYCVNHEHLADETLKQLGFSSMSSQGVPSGQPSLSDLRQVNG